MRTTRRQAPWIAIALLAAACGGDDATSSSSVDDDRPSIVVSTDILGDVVGELVGDAADVTTIIPSGASPHDFQASAQQAQDMREADLLVVNGAGFEEGLLDVVEAAESDGVVVVEAISPVDVLEIGEEVDHDEEAEHDGDAEAEGDEHEAEADAADEHTDEGADDGHDHSGVDPHFFTDPARMAVAARGILEELVAQVPSLDTDEVRNRAEAYLAALGELDDEVEGVLQVVPDDDRTLVTNHEVFGYFADRYDFEVLGTVIPSVTTTEGASAGDLAELAHVIEEAGVPAIFADTSSPDELALTLADEVGDVEVVELYSESLGGPGSEGATYVQMVRTNATRIADALT